MLFCLMKFLLGDQIYYEWLSDGVLPSEMQNHTIIIKSIEQSFLSGSKIYIKNCNTLDSLLYPLAQWKATSQESNLNDDSNLIIYCGRRFYCNPSFRFYFHTTCDSLDKVSSSLSLLTTSINCQYSVETLLDDLRQQI
ncbi:unnamed protein product, partial [Adineta steineri]